MCIPFFLLFKQRSPLLNKPRCLSGKHAFLPCAYPFNNIQWTTDKRENTEWGILFNKTPSEIAKAETLPQGVCLGDFWGDSCWTVYRTSVVLFHPVISWIYIFMGNNSCFHMPFYLGLFKSNSLCWIVHLNCFISRQLLYIQATTTAMPCDQVFNGMTRGSYDQTDFEFLKLGLDYKKSNWIILPLLGLTWS